MNPLIETGLALNTYVEPRKYRNQMRLPIKLIACVDQAIAKFEHLLPEQTIDSTSKVKLCLTDPHTSTRCSATTLVFSLTESTLCCHDWTTPLARDAEILVKMRSVRAHA